VSILGSSVGGYTFLDPLGGIAVSFFILQQGLALSKTAFLELLDAGIDARTQATYEEIIGELVNGHDLLGVRNVRGVKSGGELRVFSQSGVQSAGGRILAIWFRLRALQSSRLRHLIPNPLAHGPPPYLSWPALLRSGRR
jgi:hypothetical protein